MTTAPAAVVAGLDVGALHDRDADALALRLAAALPAAWAAALTVATHACRAGAPHVTLSLGLPVTGRDADDAWPALADAVAALGGGALALGERADGSGQHVVHAREAAAAHMAQVSGRAVVFPGAQHLPAELAVRELLDGTAVDRVRMLAAGDAPPGARLVTRGFVRPVWSQGDLVLHVQPAAGGVLVPFESPDPTPCCAHHA